MNDPPVFKDCDAEHVFKEVEEKTDREPIRALWDRIRREVRRKGVGAATTYLHGEFDRLKQDFSRALDAAKPSR